MTKIKKLEWQETEPDIFTMKTWFAAHPFGGYHIHQVDTTGYGRIRFMTTPISALKEHETFEQARDFVQAEFESKIREVIEQ